MGWFDELCSETTPMRNTLYQFLVAIVNVSSSTLAVVNEPIIYMESMRLQPRVMHARSLFVRNFKRKQLRNTWVCFKPTKQTFPNLVKLQDVDHQGPTPSYIVYVIQVRN